MDKRLRGQRQGRRVSQGSARLPAAITVTLLLCLLFLSSPIVAQDGPELTSALIDQRIAALRGEGVADSDEPLKTYRSIDLWLDQYPIA